MSYKDLLKSVLTDICDAKLEEAVSQVYKAPYVRIERAIAKIILKRYFKLVREELGIK